MLKFKLNFTCTRDPCKKFLATSFGLSTYCEVFFTSYNTMGWLWSNSAEKFPSQEKPPTSPPSITKPSPAPQHNTPRTLTRDELAELELQSFLQEIEADSRPSSTKYNRVPRQVPSPDTPTSHHSDEPLSEQLLPKTMSCRDAFDAAFYCNSMGGQFNNLYRYGTVRSCSDSWNDFWFCMRTRGFGDKEKEEAIKTRYKEKEKARYGKEELKKGSEQVGRSSEDVWMTRDTKMEWGEAFSSPFPDSSHISNEEWNQIERENRCKPI
jgi:hypothetical protein